MGTMPEDLAGVLGAVHGERLLDMLGRAVAEGRGDVELLDADETRGKAGSPVYSVALLDRRAGTIQPLADIRGPGGAAIPAGAEIFAASPVSASARQG